MISREQLRRAGFSPSAIRWAESSRRLEQVFPSVFRVVGTHDSWSQRAMVALLAAGSSSVLSHHTAARMFRLDVELPRGQIDVTITGSRVCVPPGVILHRRRHPPATVRTTSGWPITTLAQTLVDLAPHLDDELLEIALDAAHRRYRALPRWLAQLSRQLEPRTPGLTRLMDLVAQRGGQCTDSSLEVRVWRRLRAIGLKPKLQHRVFDAHGHFVARLDFAWLQERVVLHVDSYEWHDGRVAFDHDAEQRNQLHELGWDSVVVTKTLLDDPRWLNTLRAALAVRNPQLELLDFRPVHSTESAH